METDICIIGTGPAGMMAACAAAAQTKIVSILESNTTAGRKLLLTGGGRCNLTHTGSPDEIIKAYKPFDRFVRHCIHEFSPRELMEFVHRRDVKTVVEPSGCVFPKSQRSGDIKRILVDELKKLNVKMLYGSKVQSVKKDADGFTIFSERHNISAKSLIIATGGVSWPQTGSTGDGYKFAQSFGHKIIKPKACLVPFVTAETFCSSLAGIGIQNVVISCKIANKKVSSTGPMIFTQNGIGGPAVFDLSRTVADILSGNLKISIDLLPDIKSEELDKKLADCFSRNPRQTVISAISQFLPKAVVHQICLENKLLEIQAGRINKQTRKTIVGKLKNFELSVISTGPIERATVTRGGVDTIQIDPKTMQSKLHDRLFFAGEVIDVDGPCGGYNLQFAFSSGFLAGKSAAQLLE